MFRSLKKDIVPGTLQATPSSSRKAFKVEGLSSEGNRKLLEEDLKSKPRWRCLRHKLSGGMTQGIIVLGDQFVTFLKADTVEVAFSQPYTNIMQYGRESANRVFWVFYPPAAFKVEPVRYVFEVSRESRENIPEDCAADLFWLEEMDRAVLEANKRRFRLDQEATNIGPVKVTASDAKKLERLGSKDTVMSMFADPAVNRAPGYRTPPKTLDRDRFPATWVEYKILAPLMAETVSELPVLLVPTGPGVIILNPCTDGNAEFLGAMICIPWASIKSWGTRRIMDGGRFGFCAVSPTKGEQPFAFKTERGEELQLAFEKCTASRVDHDDLFPTQWPPLRY